MKKLITLVALAFCFNINAQIINTVAGNGTGGYLGDGGLAILGQLNNPCGIATDQYRNLYIADMNNSCVRKVVASTGKISTIAGNGTYGYSGDNQPATAAELSTPFAVAVDASGNVYIADRNNSCVRMVNSSGIISTFAGTGTPGNTGNGGAANQAQLGEPTGIAVDASGNVYIADYSSNAIRMVSGGIISTIAGNGTQGYSGDNGSAVNAQLNKPTGVTVDASGNIYIADNGNNVVRMVSGGNISTVAGNNGMGAGYSGDGGQATSAQLSQPWGVTTGSGNVYIADYANQAIRQVNSSGVISTIAGNGTQGYSGDCGAPTAAQLGLPTGAALDSYGNLYIADNVNNAIRKILFTAAKTHVTTQATFTAVCSGNAVTFTGSGANTYTWTGGVVNATPFVPPVNTTTAVVAYTYSVTGTDTNNCTATSTATISVYPLPVLSVASATICAGQSVTLNATLTSPSYTVPSTKPSYVASAYVWTNGIINGVAFSPTTTSSYIVTGTDGHGCSSTATATVTVISVPSTYTLPVVTISSSPITTCGVSATLTANGATTYTWSTGQNSTSIVVTPTISSTYSVSGTLQGCVGTYSMTQLVNAINVTNSIDTLCKGTNDTLWASPTVALDTNQSIKYVWTVDGSHFTTGLNYPIAPTVSTTYTVTGTIATITTNTAGVNDTTHCATGQTFTQIVRTLTASSNTTDSLCNGAMATLTANGANTYTWNPGNQNGASIVVSPTVATTYTVTGTAQTCTVTGTVKQLVKPPVTVTISSSMDTVCVGGTATLTATGATTYTWSTFQSGTSIVVTPTISTNYAVQATSDGCSTITNFNQPVNSSCFEGIKQISSFDNNVRIYPNPAINGSFTVSMDNNTENTNVVVLNALGQKVFEARKIGQQTQVALPNCLPGVYYVQINNGINGTSVKKIIIE
jgi:hypothetical protein